MPKLLILQFFKNSQRLYSGSYPFLIYEVEEARSEEKKMLKILTFLYVYPKPEII